MGVKAAKRVAVVSALLAVSGSTAAIVRNSGERMPDICEAVDHNGDKIVSSSYQIGQKVLVRFQQARPKTFEEQEVAGTIAQHGIRTALHIEPPLDLGNITNEYTDFTHTKAIVFPRLQGRQVGLTEACIVSPSEVILPVQP